MTRQYFFGLLLLLAASCKSVKPNRVGPTGSKDWTSLLNQDDQSNWEVFIGAPHATVKGLANVDPNSDGKNSQPLGLNNDPKSVFSLKEVNGESLLHISGEIYGALTSKQEYQNYHFRTKFKWGDKKWEPRLDRRRDNGILYHCQAPHGKFWNVWMQSQEFQVQQGDMGDFYALVSTQMDIPSEKKEGEREFTYQKGAKQHPFSNADKSVPIHCNKGFDNENPHGEWNTLELVCLGDTSLHIVNGKVVMALFNSKYQNAAKEILPLQKGFIQIQSEGAEAFYKQMEIKTIDAIPAQFSHQF